MYNIIFYSTSWFRDINSLIVRFYFQFFNKIWVKSTNIVSSMTQWCMTVWRIIWGILHLHCTPSTTIGSWASVFLFSIYINNKMLNCQINMEWKLKMNFTVDKNFMGVHQRWSEDIYIYIRIYTRITIRRF